MRYIEKRIYSGDFLEIEKYPATKNGRHVPSKENEYREAQKKMNEKNSLKKLIRLLHTNFTKADNFLTLTYAADKVPGDLNRAKRELVNFVRRLKWFCDKEKAVLKYISVTEKKWRTVNGNRICTYHHHLVVTGLSMDKIDKVWGERGYTKVSRIWFDENGVSGLARYLTKDKPDVAYHRRYNYSRNLKQPTIEKKDMKRLNIFKQPLPPKGYRIVTIDNGVNPFTGPYQNVLCVRENAAHIPKCKIFQKEGGFDDD